MKTPSAFVGAARFNGLLGRLMFCVALLSGFSTPLQAQKIGGADITEEAAPFGTFDVDWLHTITVTNVTTKKAVTQVSKEVPYAPGDVNVGGGSGAPKGWSVTKAATLGKANTTTLTWTPDITTKGLFNGDTATFEYSTYPSNGNVIPYTSNAMEITSKSLDISGDPEGVGSKSTGTVTNKLKTAAPATPKSKVGTSAGNSVFFDAVTSLLSFANDFIVGTGTPGDPVIGAAVNPPQFLYMGATPDADQLLFVTAGGNPSFTVQNGAQTFVDADTVFLTYVLSSNTFYASLFNLKLAGSDATSPFFDPALPTSVMSAFLDSLRDVLDPASVNYSATDLVVVYRPDDNFFTATAGFTQSSNSTIENFVFADLKVAEPPHLYVLALTGLLLWQFRRRVGAASARLNDKLVWTGRTPV